MWSIHSEVTTLKSVLLHQPGTELENLIPRYLEDLLFDEIPWLKQAQVEHNGFATLLKEQGVEVVYLLDLIHDILDIPSVKADLVREHLLFSRISNSFVRGAIFEYLLQLTNAQLVHALTAGVSKVEVVHLKPYPTLSDLTVRSYPFYLDPMPSLYFTRDHGVMIGNRLLVSSMFNFARRRETIFLRFLQQYHPRFKDVGLWFHKEIPTGIEGGDVLVINEFTLCIGLSERTTEFAIEYVARELLLNGQINSILVIEIPAKRAYMHLDTVFTMVDFDTFLMYPGIGDQTQVYKLQLGKDKHILAHKMSSLKLALEQSIKAPVRILYSGGSDPITAAREQWADSTNTLAIGPGKVITYNRNQVTNELLDKNGIEVFEVEGSELVRGRGGPRCMSMPLSRK